MTDHRNVMTRAVRNDWYHPKQHMVKAEKLLLKARLPSCFSISIYDFYALTFKYCLKLSTVP